MSDDLRKRYGDAISAVLDKPNGAAYRGMLPAALMAVRDDELAEMRAELDRLRREVARVREVLAKPGHRCLNPWPCTTIRALDGEE